MKVMRCKLLEGREVPRSCHVRNKRKDYCENSFVTDEENEIKWLRKHNTTIEKRIIIQQKPHK